jgi:hypothetical protein
LNALENDEDQLSMPLGEAFLAWRREQVTVEQVESQPILDHDEPLRPEFDGWQELKRLMEPGDELWTFGSPPYFWDRHTGWQGLLLVRDGELIEFVVTAQN